MGAIVSLRRCPDYEPANVRAALGVLLEPFGGLAPWVGGKQVLLKPNFLLFKPIHKAVNTHPEVIVAVAEAALAAGAREVGVADSPILGTARSVAGKLGLLPRLSALGVQVHNLDEEVEVRLPGALYPTLRLARRVIEAEVVLNLAKLKTHGLCGLTLAVKNCFGAVVGLAKPQWHLRTNDAPARFGAMLVEICRRVAPVLSLVDAVDSMDGEGPSAGRVRRTGFFAAGQDPFALDRALARLLRVPEAAVATVAVDGRSDLEAIQLVGDPPAALEVTDWRLPRAKSGALASLVPTGFLRRRLAPFPRFSKKLCTRCQQCLKVCPAKALTLSKDRVRLDDRACIRCFCCQEACPEGAIRIRRGWLKR